MSDLRMTIDPKSDQINADDFIGGPRTIKVTAVRLLSEADQPVAISFDGDRGKPYKPCKSMRRVLVNVWGGDGNAYVGRSMTLYRDDAVTFGGMAVGGIRISHMSHIKSPVTMALTATRANRKPFTVRPLAVIEDDDLVERAEEAAAGGVAFYQEFWKATTKAQKGTLLPKHEALKAKATEADAQAANEPDEGVPE